MQEVEVHVRDSSFNLVMIKSVKLFAAVDTTLISAVFIGIVSVVVM